jgi:hypothetical protein
VDKPGYVDIHDIETILAHPLEGRRPFFLRDSEVVHGTADQDNVLASNRKW